MVRGTDEPEAKARGYRYPPEAVPESGPDPEVWAKAVKEQEDGELARWTYRRTEADLSSMETIHLPSRFSISPVKLARLRATMSSTSPPEARATSK